MARAYRASRAGIERGAPRGSRRCGTRAKRSPRCASGIEAVARAAHGDEMPRLLGVELEPLAELTDEVVDGAHRAGRLAPDQLEQLGAREHLAGVADEEHEQLELEMGELDLRAVARDQALGGVDGDLAERERGAVGGEHRR